ncbi:MAG: R3H domain-containing nucleic acid-binding protein [bacterium]|nr:R3H domain-containing nucleic acid-binding protein [bacterium]
MTPQEFEKLKVAAQDFFGQTGLALEVDVKNQEDSTILVNVKADEPQFLIGERGQTLSEIQRLLRAVLRRKAEDPSPFYVDVDINDYKKKKAEYLKEVAQTAADEVAITKKEKELPSMPPYERRVVHTELASRTDISTESIGEEPERRVKIKPRSPIV